MLVVLIFTCGLFIGKIIEWFAYKIPKEENTKKLSKGVFKYIKKFFNKRVALVILTAIFYSILYLKYNISIDFLKYCIVSSVLVLIAIVDHKTKYVYFSTILVAFLLDVGFITVEFFYGMDVKMYIIGALFAFVVSTILSLLKVFGWGDVEIFSICGMLVGLNKIAVIMLISITLCGLYGLFLMIKERKILIKTRTAFGPYIIAALIAVIIVW